MTVDRPFVDRPISDVDTADRAATGAAVAWGLGQPELLRRGMNALYACGEIVLRVGYTAAAAHLAHDLAGVMERHGVPTIAPVIGLAGDFGGVSVTAWRRVEAVPAEVDWVAVGAAVRHVHDLASTEIPAGYPTPSPSGFPWWDFAAVLGEIADVLDAPARRGLAAAIDRNEGWQQAIGEGAVVCHGDVHPGNVLMSAKGPLLIDWDLLCMANPAWDHAMLTTYAGRWGGDPGVYPAFADGYGTNRADDPLTVSLAELRNVAATLMRVRAGLVDRAARIEAERRLQYWRGDRRAPTWRAQ